MFDKGEYYRAITEYERHIFSNEGFVSVDSARLQILRCYYNGERYKDLIDIIERPDFCFKDSQNVRRGNLLAAKSSLKLRYPHLAEKFLLPANKTGDRLSTREYDEYYYIKGIIKAYQLKWENAKEDFYRIKSGSFAERSEDCLLLVNAGQNLKYKSKLRAGLYSIVPGAGYVYTGYYQTAISAFIVNSLLGWGSYQAFKSKNTGLGILGGLLALGWYSGSIYGSIERVDAHNTAKVQQILVQFRF